MPSGKSMKGTFNEGKREGDITITFSDGRIEYEIWKDGKRFKTFKN